MKHLTRKITIGLLATTLSLSATDLLARTLSPSATDPTPSYSLLDLDGPMLKEQDVLEYSPEKGSKESNDPKQQFGDVSLQELMTFKKICKKTIKNHALSKEEKKRKLEQAMINAENDAYKEEKKSTWERLKNWFFKLDTTKVLGSIVSGTFALIVALLSILL